MCRKNGFTLLEVLIVVVIAVSVAAFAVPAYKRTQEKNKYLAAQGVLLDLGTAVRALRADLRAEGSTTKFPPLTHTVMTVTDQTEAGNSLATELSNQNVDTLRKSLFSRRYMQPIAYDSGSTYKGFSFVLCPDGTASSSLCCNSNSSVVACMYNDSLKASTSSTAGQYWGAVVKTDGSIQRLSNSN